MGAPERKGGEMAHRGEADATAETHGDSGTAQGVVPDGAARIPFAAAEIAPDAREAAARVLASGWVTTGPEVQAFEREFAAWVGAGHALAVSSCTAAIELALRGLDLPPGSKVLTSVLTFCGAVHAITHAGHRPVFADVDGETLMPGLAETAAAAERAGGVDAMLVLHFAGAPAPVAELAAAAGLPLDRVVEDAAHALGTSVGDHQVGTLSSATCFSFYATKNLPIGEGGMLTTADAGLAEWLRGARLHGMSRDAWRRYLPGANWRYRVEADGLKANMTDVQAAIGRAQLGHLGGWQERRRELAERYDKHLAQLPGVTAPWRPRPRRAGHRARQARDRLLGALHPAAPPTLVPAALGRGAGARLPRRRSRLRRDRLAAAVPEPRRRRRRPRLRGHRRLGGVRGAQERGRNPGGGRPRRAER